MNGRTCGAIFLAITALVGSCETLPVRVVPSRDAITPSLRWPHPPQQPRIQFVRAVAHPKDLGIESSFWQRLWGVIVGPQEEWFIRPTGVATNGQAIFVTDGGGQALWILNPQEARFHKIQEAGSHRLISPVAVALGSKNRLYLADSYLGKIFVYDSEAKLLDTISHPNFRRPAGLAYDAQRDRLYVADSAAHRVWIFTGDGKPLGAIGQRGTGNGEFNFPTHVAVDRKGAVYITDALNFRLQIFNADESFAGEFGQHGDSSGDFASPKGVAVDSEGQIYVVDALFDAVQIFDRKGQYLLTFGERGIGLGQFWLPGGIFIDDRDRIYVADAYNQRIQIFQYLAGSGAK